MSTILVTGGAGFIGSTLCDRLLAEDHKVIAVDDLSTGKLANLADARGAGKQFSFQNFDIRSDGLLTLFEHQRLDAVVHLAANPSVAVSIADPLLDASANVLGLLNVLQASVAAHVGKVVFATSGGTIYGESRKVPVKETAASGARPLSPYGITKKVADDYLRYYQRQFGLEFTSLALANVYGPRQDPHGESGVISIFIEQMLAGETPTIYGDGNQTRDFVYVDDVVHAFVLALDSGAGKLINVGTGLESTVNGVYQQLARLTGFDRDPANAPKREGELRRSALDISLAEDALGWKPWTHLEDGLAETVAFFKGI